MVTQLNREENQKIKFLFVEPTLKKVKKKKPNQQPEKEM